MIPRRSLLLLPLSLVLLAAGSSTGAPRPADSVGSVGPADPANDSANLTTAPADDPVLWPEEQRAFLQDGPALLLPAARRAELLAADEAGRERLIRAFLDLDPIPETAENELVEGIRRRQELVRSELPWPGDVRARALFLNGRPDDRMVIDCGAAFVPIEIWTWYDPAGAAQPAAAQSAEKEERRKSEWRKRFKAAPKAIFYRPGAGEPFKLWLPIDSKSVLYTSEMEDFLQQLEELRGQVSGVRFDIQACKEAPIVDLATGVDGLHGFQPDRPHAELYQRFLAPPADLAAWARKAAATPLPEAKPALAVDGPKILFPAAKGQRIVVRGLVTVAAGGGFQPVTEDGKAEVKLVVEGEVEQASGPFTELHVRYRLPPPLPGRPLALAFESALRPERSYLLRLHVYDEGSGAEAFLVRGFEVPAEPQPVIGPEDRELAMAALGEELALQRPAGADSLLLVPPASEVVTGLWRAEAIVTGSRIQKVAFVLDGKRQLVKGSPPWEAELRLNKFPVEQVIRVEGYDAADALVAADELALNQPRGALRVRILEPPRGNVPPGHAHARAEIVVPEERKVQAVEFRIDDQVVATLTHPPWETDVTVPAGEEITYLTVAAVLDNGDRAEDVRFLNAPRYLERVDVDLVELYTAVTDRANRPATGLTAADFAVREDGRPQKIERFELVKNLPLTVAIVIDTSGSMSSKLLEAQRAGSEFLSRVLRPKDRCFVVGFANAPTLLMAPTDDREACGLGLERLQAEGATALHDALVSSLYYFRGVRGQRALVLLSDGDDTSSTISFADALEYAQRSGVAIYAVGLDVPATSFGVRKKLNRLSEETGGRTFFVSKAEELSGVYSEIEEELRSRYLLAYTSNRPPAEGQAGFRNVEVEVKRPGLKARTIHGYYP